MLRCHSGGTGMVRVFHVGYVHVYLYKQVHVRKHQFHQLDSTQSQKTRAVSFQLKKIPPVGSIFKTFLTQPLLNAVFL
jgi:hypothetical protein